LLDNALEAHRANARAFVVDRSARAARQSRWCHREFRSASHL